MIRTLLVVTALLAGASPHLNVFLGLDEVRKLMGLNAELYYVTNGTINTYAMGYNVPVQAHISDLEFSWQSLTPHPLYYTMAVVYDDRGVLLPPQVNISERGVIPTMVQTFRIHLPCNGLKNAEIQINLQVNITSSNKIYKDIWLNFKRNKVCLQTTVRRRIPTGPSFEQDLPVLPPQSRNNSVRMAADSLIINDSSFYVAAGCAFALITLIVSAASLVYLRSKKMRNHESFHTSYTTAAYGSHGNVFIRLDAMGRPASAGSGSYATIASIHKYPMGNRRSPSPYATTHLGGHLYSRPEPPAYFPPNGSYCESDHLTKASQISWKSDSADRIKRLLVPRSDVILEKPIHEGTFGRLLHGRFQADDVVVKTVSEAATKIQISLLVSEGSLLVGMTHDNLLSPIAACLPSGSLRPLIVYPYTENGNLKKFLLERRCGMAGKAGASHLVTMAMGAARGLVYLHTRKIIHRDVAARNCVVDESLQVKIADNALSRDLYPEDYHCLCDNENRPIKWMALEALQYAQFSPASDVWSFGVLLWELSTLAQQPYSEVDPFEVTAFLRDGYRLSQPINCPDELYTVMSCCWLSSPDARPSLVQLLAFLQDFQTALAEYI